MDITGNDHFFRKGLYQKHHRIYAITQTPKYIIWDPSNLHCSVNWNNKGGNKSMVTPININSIKKRMYLSKV